MLPKLIFIWKLPLLESPPWKCWVCCWQKVSLVEMSSYVSRNQFSRTFGQIRANTPWVSPRKVWGRFCGLRRAKFKCNLTLRWKQNLSFWINKFWVDGLCQHKSKFVVESDKKWPQWPQFRTCKPLLLHPPTSCVFATQFQSHLILHIYGIYHFTNILTLTSTTLSMFWTNHPSLPIFLNSPTKMFNKIRELVFHKNVQKYRKN